MSVLRELSALLSPLAPVETGVFSDVAPVEYLVLTPLFEEFSLFGDNAPLFEVSEVRISLFSKGNYIDLKNKVTAALLGAEFTVTDRRYIGHEDGSGYHHFAIDVAKAYEMEE